MIASSVWASVTPTQLTKPPAALALLLGIKDDHRRHGKGGGKGNCTSAAEPCAVPEGGSKLAYLALSGSVCLGAIAYRRRRKYSE